MFIVQHPPSSSKEVQLLIQLLTYVPVLGLYNFLGTLVRVDLLKQELLSSNGSEERAGLGSELE